VLLRAPERRERQSAIEGRRRFVQTSGNIAMKRWIPKLAPTNRDKRLIVLLIAASCIVGDMVRRGMLFDKYVLPVDWVMLARPWMGLAADSSPIVLFAGIMFWWYSD